MLPKWLEYIDFGYKRVADMTGNTENNYEAACVRQGVTIISNKSNF